MSGSALPGHDAARPDPEVTASSLAKVLGYQAGDDTYAADVALAVVYAVVQHMAEGDFDHAILDLKVATQRDGLVAFMMVSGVMCEWLLELGAGTDPRDVMHKVQERVMASAFNWADGDLRG